MKHLRRFNEAKEYKPDELASLVVEFLELMKEKGFVKIDNFTLEQSKSDHNMIKITDGKKPLYTIWVQTSKAVGDENVGGGIFGYYPGEYHTFAIVGNSEPYITEKRDYKNCINEFKKVISSIKRGDKGTKGKFNFPIPDISERKPIKPLQLDISKLDPKTVKILRDILKKEKLI